MSAKEVTMPVHSFKHDRDAKQCDVCEKPFTTFSRRYAPSPSPSHTRSLALTHSHSVSRGQAPLPRLPRRRLRRLLTQ
jgi:hypothetical protein